MYYKTDSRLIKLLNIDGSFRCYLTVSQVKTEIRNGNIRRHSCSTPKSQVYQLVAQAKPSEAKNSKPLITRTDLLKLVGLQRLAKDREDIDIERLVGFGLIPEGTPVPAHGYLRV